MLYEDAGWTTFTRAWRRMKAKCRDYLYGTKWEGKNEGVHKDITFDRISCSGPLMELARRIPPRRRNPATHPNQPPRSSTSGRLKRSGIPATTEARSKDRTLAGGSACKKTSGRMIGSVALGNRGREVPPPLSSLSLPLNLRLDPSRGADFDHSRVLSGLQCWSLSLSKAP